MKIPSFNKPALALPFSKAHVCDLSRNAVVELFEALEWEREKVEKVFRGELTVDMFKYIVHLPRILDFSTFGQPTKVISLFYCSVHRIIVLDATAVNLIHFLSPFSWDGTQFLITDSVGDLAHPHLIWGAEDHDFIAQVRFEAQALFSIDHNIGFQSDITTLISNLGENFGSYIPNFKDHVSCICKFFVMLRNMDDSTTISACFLDLLLSWQVPLKLAQDAWALISNVCPNVHFVAQSGGHGVDVQATGTLFTCLCTVLAMSALPSNKMLSTVMYRLSNLGKAVVGYNNIVDVFKLIFEKVYKIVFTLIYGVSPVRTETEEFYDELSAWFVKVSELAEMSKQDEINIKYDTCREIERTYMQGLEYHKRLELCKLPYVDKEPFLRYWFVIGKIYDRVIVNGARRSDPRTEPVCIHLFGDSGVGKSGLVYLISQDICALEGLSHKVLDETYFRNVEQEFWDGYHGQMVCVYDDFGQIRDSNGNPNPEFMEVIRSQNIAPWPLHMAHLEDKARTKFVSRAVLLTSNAQKYNIGSLTHEQAFFRRINIQAKVSIKDQYRNSKGRLDTSRVDNVLDSNVYLFTLYDADTSRIIETNLDYDAFIKIVADAYRNSFLSSKQRLEALQRRASDFEAQVNGTVQLDKMLFPVVWLQTKKLHPYYTLPIDPSLERLLREAAVQTDNYFQFCCDAMEICPLDILIQYVDSTSFQPLDMSLLENNLAHSRAQDSRIHYFKNLGNSLKNKVLTWWDSLHDDRQCKLKIFGSIILGFLGLYTVSKTATMVKRMILGEKTENFMLESRELDKLPRKSFVTESKELAKNAPRPFVGEATADPNAQELFQPFSLNTYILYTKRNGEWKRVVNCVFVRGRCALMVAHARAFLSEECLIRGLKRDEGFLFNLSDVEFCQLRNSEGVGVDAMLVQFPRSIVAHKDIVKHFSLSKDLGRFKNTQGCLVVAKEIQFKHQSRVAMQNVMLNQISSIDTERYTLTSPDAKYSTWQLRQGYIYQAETSSGDCSALLIATCKSLQRKILGIHVAGGKADNYALAQLVTQGMLEKGLEHFNFLAQVAIPELDGISEIVPDVPDGSFVPIGVSDRVVPQATVTELHPSPVYNLIQEPMTAPAVLKPTLIDGEMVDPLLMGLRKCGGQLPRLDLNLVRRCAQAVKSLIGNGGEKTVFTFEVAITGVEGKEFLKPVNRQSSPGYPWIFMRQGTVGKTQWLGSDQEYKFDDDLRDQCALRVQRARAGLRTSTIWIDTLKDERRSLEKVALAKTRVFSAGPMDFIIVFRQYFLAFNAYMMEKRIYNGSGVGINPYNSDWHVLAMQLQSKGPHVFAGDFSNFDGSLHSEVMWTICDLINDWYDDGKENRQIREILFFELVNSIHVYRDNVYAWTHSQPSGNPLTAILNTLYNLIIMRYIFVLTTQRSIIDFDRYVYMVAFGDDNVLNVSDKIVDKFNLEVASSGFRSIGMTYTSENKDGTLYHTKTLGEINFLKRYFKMDEILFRYVGPLELTTILEMTMWVRGKIDHEERCRVILEKAFGELAIHGYEVFHKWAPHIYNIACNEMHVHIDLYDYLDYKGLDLDL